MPTRAVQIRNVPERMHRRLKMQAAASGQSLSDYLLAELRRIAERPTREEMLARLEARTPVILHPDAATLVAEDRLER